MRLSHPSSLSSNNEENFLVIIGNAGKLGTAQKKVTNKKIPSIFSRLISKNKNVCRRKRIRVSKEIQSNKKKSKKKSETRTTHKDAPALNNSPVSEDHSSNTNCDSETLDNKIEESENAEVNGLDSNQSQLLQSQFESLDNIDLTKEIKQSTDDKSSQQGSVRLDQICHKYKIEESCEQDSKPDPVDYDTEVNEFSRWNIDFGIQTSRYTRDDDSGKHIGSVIKNINSMKPRVQGQLPFDKQLSRYPSQKRKEADIWEEVEEEQVRIASSLLLKTSKEIKENRRAEVDIWKEIEEEQARIVSSLLAKAPKKIKVNKKKEPFSLQTRNKKMEQYGPFYHIMRKEIEPKEEYDIERSYKYLNRPINVFNIAQPSQKSDRSFYNKSDAPDVFYDNVHEGWEKTHKSNGLPSPWSLSHDRRSFYDYLPHASSDKHVSNDMRTIKNHRADSTIARPAAPSRPETPYLSKSNSLKRITDTPVNLQRPSTARSGDRYTGITEKKVI